MFVSEMFDQMRDLLNDDTDAQVSFARKKRYLNRGIARLWPHVYSVQEYSLLVTTGTDDYVAPVELSDGIVLSVERSSDASGDYYTRYSGPFDILPGDEDESSNISILGARGQDFYLRIMYAAPVPTIVAANYTAAQSEPWAGPDRAIGLPVLYALALATAAKLDDRQDTSRYMTTQQMAPVDDRDIVSVSQMWMGQFELELADMARPFPIAKD